jgi:hypothetical protein
VCLRQRDFVRESAALPFAFAIFHVHQTDSACNAREFIRVP